MKSIIFVAILHCVYLASAESEPFQLPDSIKDLEIPDMDEFAVIKEKCDKEGGNGTYIKFKTTANSLSTCMSEFVSLSTLEAEVMESKKTGSMDEVFGKYCKKRSQLATCVQSFINNLRLCLNAEEQNALNITLNIVKELGEFACFKDGDRIAMFVAEGGVECIKSRTQGIQNCVNSTFKISPQSVNPNAIPNILIDKKKCDDLGKLQRCVVEELEKCKDSTPANIVDALFKFVKRSACSNKNKRSAMIHRILKRHVATVNHYFNSSELNSIFESTFREKCKNAPENGFKSVQESFKIAKKCIYDQTTEYPIFATPLEKFQEEFKKCTDDFAEKAKVCLPEKEKYFPEFYQKIFINFIEFLYNNQNTILRVSSRSELVNCFQNFKQHKAKSEMSKCFHSFESTSLEKDAVCTRITKTKSCVTGQLQKRCIRDVTVNQLVEDFFEVLLSPCDKSG
ncbi:uncharacterized protein LOC656540 [Tribolium castaneum]|uniref:27 kDa hemolymph protein-like Protein n=1 Tax=Tribolium castaneum TaxID=7070 RepID=D6X314_TRICA|nr:PREDICTED: uncharacterized protein LOC656540 [Tribolium castaneum]EFA10305.2 hypothetical protein TcasGA2_TC012520 [Tribolium castaneum]|eukprot:XP_968158.1 PREDICTED: uncharacterized protein LOC656540 [Tribolium castaneum]